MANHAKITIVWHIFPFPGILLLQNTISNFPGYFSVDRTDRQ